MHACEIVFNGHAKPCVDCDKLEPQHPENVSNCKRMQQQAAGWTDGWMDEKCVYRRQRVRKTSGKDSNKDS